MNAQEINIYKIKNIQKINQAAKTDKIKVSPVPKRYMENVSARFSASDKPAAAKNGAAVFFDSLAGMTENDIELNETARNMKKPSVDFVRYFMLLLSLGIFAYTGYILAGKIYSYIAAAREYDTIKTIFYADDDDDGYDSSILKQSKANKPIQDIFTLQTQGTQIIEAELNSEIRDVEKKQQSVTKLTDINPDYYAWVRVNGTTINYPVVQTTDNEHYLHYTFLQKKNDSGAIFADYENSRDIPENRHMVIYGHNMLNNTMFQPLITHFFNRENNFKTGIITLEADGKTYCYEVFSIREEDPDSGYIQTNFAGGEDWLAFLNSIKERSQYQKDVAFDENTQMITLSTCVNDTKINRRYAVSGILIAVQ